MKLERALASAESEFLDSIAAALAEYDIARARRGISPGEPTTGHEPGCECAVCESIRATREMVTTYQSGVSSNEHA